ncbi:MAG: hypothetical protein AAF367_10555 [Pseudomonadota bacterium]
MELTPIGGIVAMVGLMALLTALAPVRWRLRPAAALLGATIPLSAAAAAVLGWGGGASILLSALSGAVFVVAVALNALRAALAGQLPALTPSAGFLLAFLAIAVIGSVALPRVFAGETLVFSLDRTAVGVTGGILKLPLVPLRPSAGTLTQSVWLISTVAVFCAAIWAIRRDAGLLGVTMMAATLSHLGFAVLDFAGWSGMTHLRTAAYQIASEQAFAGFTRLSGAATEPSQFGTVSAALAAWHLWHWRSTARSLHLISAAALLAGVIASMSTTALVAAFPMLIIFCLGAVMRPHGYGTLMGLSLIMAGLVGLIGWALVGPNAAAISAAADAMFAGKLTSESGVERSIWAAQALTNFQETMGLGAGLGAAKASGWASALLGQTGLPGTILMLLFLVSLLSRSPADTSARAMLLTIIAAAILSEGRVDPGYLFALAAGAMAANPAPRLQMRSLHAPNPA